MGEKTNNTIQAFWVAIGSFSAFMVSIVSTMILSRYFDKSDYGTYRQVLYVYQTLLIAFTIGLPKAYAYFLPRVELKYAKSLINKITNIFYVLGGVFSLSLFIFSPLIADILKNPDLEIALRIFSPVPFFLLPTMGIEGIFASYQKNKYMAMYNLLTKTFILLCVSLPVIIFNGTYKDALIGFTIASVISFLVANYMKYWCIKTTDNEKTNITYKEVLKFSLPLMYASIWGIIAVSADKFFISRYFGAEVFAEFSNGSLQLPFVGMIIGACSTILMPLFSRKIHEQCDPKSEILPIWKSVFEKTIKITYPLVIFFLFFSDYIMVLLYGSHYSNSGIYFAIMLTVNFFTVISYFPILIAIGASRFYTKVQMFGALAIIVLEYLSILIFDSPYVVTVVSVVCTIGKIGIMLKFLAKYFNVKFFKLIPIDLVIKILIPSTVILFTVRSILSMTDIMHEYLLLGVTISLIAYLALYALVAKIVHIDYVTIVKKLFKKIS